MAFVKLTNIKLTDGKIIQRRGHYTNPQILAEMGAISLSYHVIDTNSGGRGGESRIETGLVNYGSASLKAAAKLA